MFNHEIHFLSVVICQRVSVCIFQMLMDHYKKQISFCLAECQYIIVQYYYVWVKRYFDPSDTELLRALHSRNSKNIRNPLIFLQKMAPYSCFGRVTSSKILLQASLHRIYDLLTLVSSQYRKRAGRRVFLFNGYIT